MTTTEWRLDGVQFSNCNCDWGCPCQFNALPTHGNCEALVFVQIDKGHHGSVTLDGLRFGLTASWPGPIHLGNGRWQWVIDERASAPQRAALERIMGGEDTDPGGSIMQVFSGTITDTLPVLYQRIDLSIDKSSGKATLHVPGIADGGAEPIRNPVTGDTHRPTISIAAGFEYTEAEVVNGNSQAVAGIPLQLQNSHAHLAEVHWSTHGLIR